MKFAYISENKMYLYSAGKVTELKSERAAKYTETVNEINKNKEWKHSGVGAEFRGDVEFHHDAAESVVISGITSGGPGMIYSIYLGGMGGLYGKDPDEAKAAEEHIFTGMNTRIGAVSQKDGRIAASVNGHISVFDMRGNCDDITDGDSSEDDPYWSRTDGRIFCTSAGYAIGGAAALSPRSVLAIDTDAGEMNELFSDSGYDFLRPKNSPDGTFYYIKQPYHQAKERTPIWKDVLLFPIRIIKAIVGFLNAFSVIFGGESLRTKQKGDVKTKEKSDRELFFEGRLLEAEKNQKENAAEGDKNPGILPRSRGLYAVGADGVERAVKKGVLDYVPLGDGSMVYSNGTHIIHLKNDEETVLVKARLADSICIIEE